MNLKTQKLKFFVCLFGAFITSECAQVLIDNALIEELVEEQDNLPQLTDRQTTLFGFLPSDVRENDINTCFILLKLQHVFGIVGFGARYTRCRRLNCRSVDDNGRVSK